jgi:hypothetical protein
MITDRTKLHKKDDVMIYNLPFFLIFIFVLSTSPALAAAPPIRIQATTASSGQAVLELQTDELVTMTVIPFRLLISDAAGKPVTGARVSCDLTMPSMSMPENRPQMTERDGAYTGEMVLTCTMGDWRATCSAEDAKGQRQTMIFDLGPARMK